MLNKTFPSKFGFAHISLAFVGLMWVLPFLYYHHAYPITTFYQEWGAALLGLCALPLLLTTRYWQAPEVPRIVMLPIGLMLLLMVQFFAGRINYFDHLMLLVILDIFSRYVVGWMLASRESEHLAERLIRETVVKQGVARDRLTLHSDRGPSMRSQTVAQLLATLGITKSHSRPHVSDDNPFSESQFKTMKYQPEFPDRFTGIEQSDCALRSPTGPQCRRL